MVQSEQSQARARLQAQVQGRVQGVSFRFYTQMRARELGVTGYVRNEWDGTVQVVAEGPRTALDELLAFLRVGPRAAMVTQVDCKWPAPTGGYGSFEVRY